MIRAFLLARAFGRCFARRYAASARSAKASDDCGALFPLRSPLTLKLVQTYLPDLRSTRREILAPSPLSRNVSMLSVIVLSHLSQRSGGFGESEDQPWSLT